MLKRYILFIVLSFLVFWLYAILYPPRPPVKSSSKEAAEENVAPTQPDQEEEEGTAPSGQSVAEAEIKPTAAITKPVVTKEQREQEEKVWLENKYCRMTFTRYGAALREVLLYTTQTNKKVVVRGKQPVRIPMRGVAEEQNSLAITSPNGSGLDLSTHPFELEQPGTEGKLTYALTLDSGLKVTKAFELTKDDYILTMDLAFENASEKPLTVSSHQVKVGTMFPLDPKAGYKEMRFLALGAGKIKKLSSKPNKAESRSFSFLRWASTGNKYFALILSPEERDRKIGNSTVGVTKVIPEVGKPLDPPAGQSKESAKKDEDYFYSLGIGVKEFTVDPGKKVVHRYTFYAGPKEYDRLKRLSRRLSGDRQFEKVMSMGWFGFVSVPLLKILKGFYSILPNYGLAIILLTILIKIVLYPLDQKSYKSMKEMQKLQPLIAELRKKYKDDPRQAQVEQMKLFKEHKVNPMGGCLPMLLQMPVLIAMFGMIRSAIELRGAPFVLWIKDLSEPDAALNFGMSFPIIGDSLNILPLVLVFAFILQSKISKTGMASGQQDPQQKMMGHFMTVFFGILFYKMPSGLNLYFAISTVLRAIQQYVVQKDP